MKDMKSPTPRDEKARKEMDKEKEKKRGTTGEEIKGVKPTPGSGPVRPTKR